MIGALLGLVGRRLKLGERGGELAFDPPGTGDNAQPSLTTRSTTGETHALTPPVTYACPNVGMRRILHIDTF